MLTFCPNAKKLKKISEKGYEKRYKEAFKNLVKKIKQAAKDGDNYIFSYYGTEALANYLATRLSEKGYKVEVSTELNTTILKIKW